MPYQSVILDTSVLVNFVVLDRIELLASHPGLRFLITDHVSGEISDDYPHEMDRLEQALVAGHLEQIRIDSPEEVEVFGELTSSGRLGVGECSAIAAAKCRSLQLGIDDRRARNEAIRQGVAVLTTQDLVVSLIQERVVTIPDADEMKRLWEERHRFRLPFESFADVVSEDP